MKYLKKYLFVFLLVITIIFSLVITNLNLYNTKYNETDTNIIGVIDEYNIDGNKLVLHIKAKEKVICNYYFKTKIEKDYYIENIKLGIKVSLKGTLNQPKNNTVPNLFNYKKYLYNNKIYWIFKVDDIDIISFNSNILYQVKNSIIEKINAYKYSKSYLYAFILGDTSKINNDVIKSYQNNGISHLFAVSGMHITLLTGLVIMLLKKIKFKDIFINIIVFIFLLFYIFLTGFSASILRASLFFILLKLNKIFNFNLKTIDVLLITISLLLIFNPFLLYNLGFQYSCIVSLTILYFSDFINRSRSYISRVFKTSLIAFLIGLPISIYNFFHINLLSVLINLIFVPFISVILFPFSILTFIFPIFDKIDFLLINILENVSLFINNIKVFDITLTKPNLIIIVIYYIIIILSLIMFNRGKIKYFELIIIMLFIHNNYSYFNSNLYMIMIDVGQGDSILIKLPNNKGNILIDTGGQIKYPRASWQITNSSYSITDDTLIPLFKSLGIKKLDYLILTHGDNDHMGEALNIVKKFKVNNIILNSGDINDLERELIDSVSEDMISFYKADDVLRIDKYSFQFLNPIENIDENENSLVIYTNFFDTSVLFMGDSEKIAENNILKKYDVSNIDILKVGHHGSKTSSTKGFIDKINPKISLISVGENNRYGHPNKETLDNLINSKIYRTDIDGSIVFKIKKNKLEIETCIP